MDQRERLVLADRLLMEAFDLGPAKAWQVDLVDDLKRKGLNTFEVAAVLSQLKGSGFWEFDKNFEHLDYEIRPVFGGPK